MPKEQINFPRWRKMEHSLPGMASEQAATAERDDTLFVRWHDGTQVEGYVQLATVSYKPCAWADSDDAVVWPSSALNPSETYSPVLSREDLNRLIKALRRARDQAYGRDE